VLPRAGDVVFYEAQVPALQEHGLPPNLAVPGARAAVAMSVAHPLCPARRNVVRARLLIAVTLFTPTNDGHCVITSFQQCVRHCSFPQPVRPQSEVAVCCCLRSADPRGYIPARVVNACVARGKVQLKEMRRVMVELG
jgi:hypothetical protein